MFVPFGAPAFDVPALVPLSEPVAPGVPYPFVAVAAAAAGDTTLGVASVLFCAKALPDKASAAAAAMNV